jgi:NAD(P)-dependent dehydrogenase (short-subunit alcohol dehydrogenase family)
VLLDGKAAIVTGAGQGVGQGIALALAAEGASVTLAGRRTKPLDRTLATIESRGGTAQVVSCDVKDADAVVACVEATVAAYGTVDILVNNAQQVPLGNLLDVTDEAYSDGFLSGPLATLRFMRACHPHLKGGGVVINLGSGSAIRTDPTGLGAYASVKDAIRVLSRAAAVEWGRDGIRVNTLLPLAMSPGMEWWSENFKDDYEQTLSEVPLGRIGDCEADIGRVAVFLCSDDARYITGTSLVVDGGQVYLR